MLAGSAWRALVAARRSLDQASPGDSLDEAQRHLSEAIRALDRTKFRLLVHARQMVTDAQRALDDPAGWAVPTLEELADHFANRPMEAEDADEG